MYFVNKVINEFKNQKLDIYVDMDGVIADYEADNPFDFENKRPVMTNIKIIEKLSTLENVTIKILSICKKNSDIELKKLWLFKYTPFIKDKNIFILCKEKYPDCKSKDLKLKFIKNILESNLKSKIIVIDDDNEIIKHLKNNLKDVIVFQDSSIID